MTILGTHVTTGSRNGYGLAAGKFRGSVSFLADAFAEMDADAFKVWRHQGYSYGGQTVLDIMPGFDQLTPEDMPAQAAHYWPQFELRARELEAEHGVKIDAIKCTNEVGGNDPDRLRALVAFERALLPLAEADGRRLVIGNYATNAPHMPLWEEICAPFIVEACRRGHIYSRHAYASDQPGGEPILIHIDDMGNMRPDVDGQRLMDELAWFRARGYHVPVIVGETGFYAMPSLNHFIDQVALWDIYLSANAPEVGFAALFTYGEWNDANIQSASAALADYLSLRPFTKWTPTFKEDGKPVGTHKAIVVKAPQEVTADEWQEMAAYAYEYRHTMTASHDDTLTVLRGGNADSYAKIFEPERRSQQETIAALEAAGFRWEAYWLESGGNPLNGLQLGAPFTVPFVLTSPFNAARSYGRHEGADYDIFTAIPNSTEPVRAIHDGLVTFTSQSAGYGNYVVIRGMNNGSDFYTWYCHLDAIAVTIGQQVKRGDAVGELGSTGNSTGEHVHINLQVPGYGLTGYVVPDVVDPAPYIAASPTPPPAPGKTYSTTFMDAEPGAWRVIRRADGSGEDVWDLPTPGGYVRVKNRNEGEWYERRADGVYRIADTSPAPDSTGIPSLYVLNNAQGGKIAPLVAEVGVTYSFTNMVQFKAKNGCANLSERSGQATSTFTLVKVIDNYTFPTTGFKVDQLFVTNQTGEMQLYAIVNGRNIGWVGGGASQAGNEWGGGIAELYFDRVIPQQEPPRYCF